MSSAVQRVLKQLSQVVLGKDEQLAMALSCILAKGHLLIEDLPGMGKTTLSHALANVLGLSYQRIQFTSDLLPADVLGVSIYDSTKRDFEFKPGPIFSQVILADEINRATPKTQGALLEAMEEQQVTVDGITHALPAPFFVIATQNPSTQMGTFPLPESQLDRFLMRISIGYPDPKTERDLLRGQNFRDRAKSLKEEIKKDELAKLQADVSKIHVSEAVLDYLQRLIDHSRRSESFDFGLSPRAGLALLRAAQAWALVQNRDHVIPDDVQQVLPAVAEHRLRGAADHSGHTGKSFVSQLLEAVDVIG